MAQCLVRTVIWQVTLAEEEGVEAWRGPTTVGGRRTGRCVSPRRGQCHSRRWGPGEDTCRAWAGRVVGLRVSRLLEEGRGSFNWRTPRADAPCFSACASGVYSPQLLWLFS
jgi:hypothetical protein